MNILKLNLHILIYEPQSTLSGVEYNGLYHITPLQIDVISNLIKMMLYLTTSK